MREIKTVYASKRDYALTPDVAKENAEKLRLKKIENLKKQIKKLETMKIKFT